MKLYEVSGVYANYIVRAESAEHALAYVRAGMSETEAAYRLDGKSGLGEDYEPARVRELSDALGVIAYSIE